jgi:hypothetical protein
MDNGPFVSKSRWRSPAREEVKAVRYEDVETGRPPMPVASVGQHRARSSGRSSTRTNTTTGSPKQQRPRTAPQPRKPGAATTNADRASYLSSEVKRDSGIAGSTTTAESHREASSPVITPARIPSLPTIVVHDADADAVRSPSISTQRTRSPFAWKKGSHTSGDKLRKSQSSEAVGLQRIRSFKAISTDIPTGGLEELDSSSIGFSTRGSLLFGGKKMAELIAAQGDAPRDVQTEKIVNTEPQWELQCDPPSQAADTSKPEESHRPGGLVAGRRKPSVHMLQAAIQGGRVLSAEEITFSMRVRSMYEHGDENAADWNMSGRQDTPESLSIGAGTPEVGASNDSLLIQKTRTCNNSLHTSASGSVRTSYTKSTHELAGGIEDWEDVQGGDVDRYGFITPNRAESRASGGQGQSFDGIHRVATGLRVAADRPRRERSMIRRKPSVSRSTRSANAQTESNGSLRSLQSNHSAKSRRSRFRSRDVRTADEAGNMLMPPPGLADIAEARDGGEHADFLQRRETARNAKWRAMARALPEQQGGIGGGMDFDFDTTDPKVISRTWKGIPDRWRATAWHSFLSSSANRRGKHTSDDELIAEFYRLQDESCADDVQIDVDVPRTISMHIMFRRRYRGGQRLLFRVLHAIAIHSPETGYVQGMASLAATLLCYYDEERAFVMLVRMWELRGMNQLFTSGFGGLMAALKEFDTDWLRGGDVAQRLNELGIDGTAYGTRWYLTLFNMSVPFAAQLRIWDVFMLLGDATPNSASGKLFGGADLDVLHATSAALIDATREVILESDFEGTMKVLTSFVPIRDEDLLMRVARAEYKMKKRRG